MHCKSLCLKAFAKNKNVNGHMEIKGNTADTHLPLIRSQQQNI